MREVRAGQWRVDHVTVLATALELQQRQRARAENVIRDAKACGLANLPFDDLVNNEVWMNLCFAANDLLGWLNALAAKANSAERPRKRFGTGCFMSQRGSH